MGTPCPNIGPREQRIRMLVGVIGSASTALVSAWLIATHAPVLARLWVSAPALMAAFGFFQAMEETCVAFAARDIKVLGDSRRQAQPVSAEEKKQIARQARRVYLYSLLSAAAFVGLIMLAP